MTGATARTPARPPAEAGAGLPLHTDALRRARRSPQLFRSASVEKKMAAQGRGGGLQARAMTACADPAAEKGLDL